MMERAAKGLEALHRRPWLVLTGVAMCVALACVGLRGVRFDSSLTVFFPPGSSAALTLAFLNDASLAGKVAVSFERDADTPENVLHEAVNDFAARAAELPGVRNVLDTIGSAAWQTGLVSFYDVMPQWFDADALEALTPRLEPEAVHTALKRRFAQLARPEGMFLVEAARHDPLGFFDAQFQAIGTAAGKLGYDVVPDGGRLMSRDGLHRLVLLETDADASDMAASEALLNGLNAALAKLPPGIRADVVCAHAHAVANQTIARRDVAVAGTLSAVLLAVMLLFGYRDVRMVMIVAAPVFAVLVAFPVCAAVFGSITFLAAAFGSILAGLSVDYGIHIYRAGGRVGPLLRPLVAGMGTTFAVFCGFFVSRAEGWRQVGCFGATAIAAAFVFSVCVLPLWSKRKRGEHGHSCPCKRDDTDRNVRAPLLRLVFALAIIIVVCAGLARLRLDNDFARLNGAGNAVFEAEERFQNTWGDKEGERAMLALKVTDAADVDEAGARLYENVVRLLRRERDQVSGFAAIAPTPIQRSWNLVAWQKFWSTDNRAARLRETLREEGAAFGFSDDAFEAFLQMVETPCDDTSIERLGPLLNLLRERFVFPAKNGGAYAVVVIPDIGAPFIAQTINQMLPKWHNEVVAVSRACMPNELAEAFGKDAVRVALVMAVLLISAAWLALRSLKLVVMALLPCVAAVGVLFGVLGLAGIPANVVHVLAGMLTLGVAFDYGLFLLYASQGRLDAGIRGDVRLCLLTTLAGSAPLMLAQHPVIFSLGLALTVGVGAGYVTAAWLLFPPQRRIET